MHVAPQVIDHDAVAHGPFDAGLGDQASIDLGQDDVGGRVDADRRLERFPDVPTELHRLVAVVQVGGRR